MTPAEIQEIKNYIAELFVLGRIISDKNRSLRDRRKAETQFISVKKIVDSNSILWLGQLIKMVEGEGAE